MATSAEIVGAISKVDNRITRLETQLEMLSDIKVLLEKQNGRLDAVEKGEAHCQVLMEGLPVRVRVLEDERERQKGALAVAKWLGGGGGLAGFLSLLVQLSQWLH